MDHIKTILKWMLDKNNLGWLEEDINLLLAILGLVSVLYGIIKIATKKIKLVYVNSFVADLNPYYSSQEVMQAKRYYVPTKCQNIPPSINDEPGQNHVFIVRENLLKFFLKDGFNDDREKYFILLADSGMGKTTFMINLYLGYRRRQWYRHLLSFNNKSKIFLFPLGFPNVLDDIKNIPDLVKKDAILLLDAFDEDQRAVSSYQDRLKEIIECTIDFKKIIITSRTQFFPSQSNEPKHTGVMKFGGDKGSHIFGKLYISPFSKKDVNIFLRKKYGLFPSKRKNEAREIIENSPNLSVRPMLLNYIDDLIDSGLDLGYRDRYSVSGIYNRLIQKWIDREASRQGPNSEEFSSKLNLFSRKVAKFIIKNRESNNSLLIQDEQIQGIANSINFNLSLLELKSRSLLNRNAEGAYKFSHKSILEYFIAEECLNDDEFKSEINFEGMDFAEKLYKEMVIIKKLDPYVRNFGGYVPFTSFGEDLSFVYFGNWKEGFNEDIIKKYVPLLNKNSINEQEENTRKYLKMTQEELENWNPIIQFFIWLKYVVTFERIFYRNKEAKKASVKFYEKRLEYINFLKSTSFYENE